MIKPRRATLLAVYAHPDDEIFHGGVLADLSARGARVQLLSLTHGEAGKVRDPSLQVNDLASFRAKELRLSCERLGIDLTLDTLHNPPPPGAEMLRAFGPVFERELFTLGATRVPTGSWPLVDFFEGLKTAALTPRSAEVELAPTEVQSVR
jgi:LmbE family N-acetylglucosaminyl deacetylase